MFTGHSGRSKKSSSETQGLTICDRFNMAATRCGLRKEESVSSGRNSRRRCIPKGTAGERRSRNAQTRRPPFKRERILSTPQLCNRPGGKGKALLHCGGPAEAYQQYVYMDIRYHG